MNMDGSKPYLHAVPYARANGELEQYRASYRQNMACARALEAAVGAYYRENHLDTSAIFAQVVGEFGADRVKFIRAETIRDRSYDGRISQESKAWAQGVPGSADERKYEYTLRQTHPGLIDLLAKRAGQELEPRKNLFGASCRPGLVPLW